MIRKFKKEDLDKISNIWLKSIVKAHGFVDDSYWESLLPKMEQDYFVENSCYIYEDNGEISAGMVLESDGSIISIFVDENFRRKCHATALIEFAKTEFEHLHTSVYKKNVCAIKFFEKNGFEVKYAQFDHNTGEEELFAEWIRLGKED